MRRRRGQLWDLLCLLEQLAPDTQGWARVCQRTEKAEVMWKGIMVAKPRIEGVLHILFVLSTIPPGPHGLRFGLVKCIDTKSDGDVDLMITTQYTVSGMTVFDGINAIYDALSRHTAKVKRGVEDVQYGQRDKSRRAEEASRSIMTALG